MWCPREKSIFLEFSGYLHVITPINNCGICSKMGFSRLDTLLSGTAFVVTAWNHRTTLLTTGWIITFSFYSLFCWMKGVVRRKEKVWVWSMWFSALLSALLLYHCEFYKTNSTGMPMAGTRMSKVNLTPTCALLNYLVFNDNGQSGR